MNRRELLKVFGLAAGTTILPLHKEWGSSDRYRLRRVSKTVPGHYQICDVYAEGISQRSAVGKVTLYSGSGKLMQFSINTFGGCVRWVPALHERPHVLKELLNVRMSDGIRVSMHVMDGDYDRLIVVEA